MYLYLNLLIHTFKSFLLFAFFPFKHTLKTIHLYFGNTVIAVYWYMITMAIVFLYFCKTIWQHFSHISHIKQTRQILVRSFKKNTHPHLMMLMSMFCIRCLAHVFWIWNCHKIWILHAMVSLFNNALLTVYALV